jgi:hypothetical protein
MHTKEPHAKLSWDTRAHAHNTHTQPGGEYLPGPGTPAAARAAFSLGSRD